MSLRRPLSREALIKSPNPRFQQTPLDVRQLDEKGGELQLKKDATRSIIFFTQSEEGKEIQIISGKGKAKDCEIFWSKLTPSNQNRIEKYNTQGHIDTLSPGAARTGKVSLGKINSFAPDIPYQDQDEKGSVTRDNFKLVDLVLGIPNKMVGKMIIIGEGESQKVIIKCIGEDYHIKLLAIDKYIGTIKGSVELIFELTEESWHYVEGETDSGILQKIYLEDIDDEKNKETQAFILNKIKTGITEENDEVGKYIIDYKKELEINIRILNAVIVILKEWLEKFINSDIADDIETIGRDNLKKLKEAVLKKIEEQDTQSDDLRTIFDDELKEWWPLLRKEIENKLITFTPVIPQEKSKEFQTVLPISLDLTQAGKFPSKLRDEYPNLAETAFNPNTVVTPKKPEEPPIGFWTILFGGITLGGFIGGGFAIGFVLSGFNPIIGGIGALAGMTAWFVGAAICNIVKAVIMIYKDHKNKKKTAQHSTQIPEDRGGKLTRTAGNTIYFGSKVGSSFAHDTRGGSTVAGYESDVYESEAPDSTAERISNTIMRSKPPLQTPTPGDIEPGASPTLLSMSKTTES